MKKPLVSKGVFAEDKKLTIRGMNNFRMLLWSYESFLHIFMRCDNFWYYQSFASTTATVKPNDNSITITKSMNKN